MLQVRWPNVVVEVGRAIASSRPGVCAVCRGSGRGRICASCLDRLAAPVTRCSRCALPLVAMASTCGSCTIAQPPFDAALAAVDYRAPWDRLVTALKFHGALDLAAAFAEAIVRVERRRARRRALRSCCRCRSRSRAGASAATTRRGSSRAGSRVGSAWSPSPSCWSAFARPRTDSHCRSPTAPATCAARSRSSRGAGPRCAAPMSIVDDVLTTGSTAAEIASVLRQAGAATVGIWVLARTPRPADA